jgi:hypothetical protein
MDLDADAFMLAFERLAERLVAPPWGFAAEGAAYRSIPFFREKKYGDLPETIEELIEDNLDDEPIANFVTLLVLRELSAPNHRHRETGDLRLSREASERGFVLYASDLEVAGNFAYELPVLVVGDLVVDGVIEDAFDSTPLLVAGSVRAKGLYLGSPTKIAGTLDVTDVLHLRFTRGGDTLSVGGAAKTKLYVWTPDDSRFTGELNAVHRVEAYPSRDDPSLARLRAELTKTISSALDVDEPDMTAIVKELRRGSIW